MDAAKEWGTPPWEINPSTPAVVWWLRYMVLQAEQVRAARQLQKEAEKKARPRRR